MKKVDRFIFKSFIGPLAMTFFIVLVIFILQFLWMYVDDLAGKGLPIKVLGELLFQFSLTFVPISLPLAILLASLMTFGNMGEFMELTALKASGIPLRRLMIPVFVFVSLISIASFLFSDYVLPISNRKARTLLYDIKRKRPELDIQAGTFYDGIDGFSIKITHKDPVTNRLDKLFIYDQRQGKGNNSVITADSGYMRVAPDKTAMILTLYNGYSYNEMLDKSSQQDEKKLPFRRDKFDKQTMVIELTGLNLQRSDMDLFRSNYSMLNSHQLSNFIDSVSVMNKGRTNNYFNDFNKTKIYSGITEPIGPKGLKVPVSKYKEIPPFAPRNILDTLERMNKITVLNKALSDARDGMSFFSDKQKSLIAEEKGLRKYETEFYKKFSLPIACIVFFFIGAPLGAIIRKGGLGTPAVISVLFFVVYYVISISAEKSARELLISPFLGMFASTFVLLPIGAFLTYKATTDSSLMSSDTYVAILRKISSRFSGLKKEKHHEDTPTDS
jgi:lipopolysaccharide export system permease protein